MNNIIYGIILYVIIIIVLVFTKPSFVYDYNKAKYREFGTDNDKTIFTLPIISIFFAIFIAIFFGIFLTKKEKTTEVTKNENIRYIPIPYYPNSLSYDPRFITGLQT